MPDGSTALGGDVVADALAGLLAPRKTLPAKLFYDAVGSDDAREAHRDLGEGGGARANDLAGELVRTLHHGIASPPTKPVSRSRKRWWTKCWI